MTRLRAWHLALLLIPAIYLLNLGALPLQLSDEPREAGIALEYWHNGPLSAPRVNGELHVVKTPVMYWCASVFLSLSGAKVPGEVPIRLPAALFSLGSILLALYFGRLWFSLRHGALAACALALSPEMVSHGRRFMTDPALAFFVTACVGFALSTLHARERKLLYAIASGVALGLGFLTKGPVAVVLSGLAIAGAVAASRGVRGFWSRDVLLLYVSYVVFLTPAVVFWVWLVKKDGGQEALDFYIRYHVGGAKGGVTGEERTPHVKPFYFYVERGSDGVMPWIFFVPLLAWRRVASKETAPGHTDAWGGAPPRPPRSPTQLREVGLWGLLPLLFLSALAPKRDLYTLPLLPPVALLAAVAILDGPIEGTPAKVAKIGWTILGGALLVGAVGSGGYALVASLVASDLAGAALGGALLAACGAAIVVARRDDEEKAGPLLYPFTVMSFGVVIATFLVAFLAPRSRGFTENSIRPLMRDVVATVASDRAVLHGYRLGDGTAVVNGALSLEVGGRFVDLETPAQLTAALADPRTRVLIRKNGAKSWDELGRPGRVVREFQAVPREGRHGEPPGWKHEYLLLAR